MKKKELRSGYTTGACAAAAAKAATMILLKGQERQGQGSWGKGPVENKAISEDWTLDPGPWTLSSVEIPLPDGSRHRFVIHDSGYRAEDGTAWVSVIKDAGDDPDVTNKAEIRAEVRRQRTDRGESTEPRTQSTDRIEKTKDRAQSTGNDKMAPEVGNNCLSSGLCALGSVLILGGKGVGVVTKPGLPVPLGEPAINPIPRRMITEAVREAISEGSRVKGPGPSNDTGKKHSSLLLSDRPLVPGPWTLFEITISVPLGEELALKTLNPRLGIAGGISILGTTGIVRPVSAEAWMATITSSMDVARALGHEEVVLSAGRASETAHMERYHLPEESYVMMGDYLEFSLREAMRHGFRKIHIAAQWAKMVKISLETPQTHVRHGALDVSQAVEFISGIWPSPVLNARSFNTAREVFDLIVTEQGIQTPVFSDVCKAAKKYAEQITGGIPVITHLVSYKGEIMANSSHLLSLYGTSAIDLTVKEIETFREEQE
ncbi:MAG: cobalt-precorrin-5B (C(1))-methyltransferase [Nitrospirales bacterium]|nr:cobalt-precorrin-5B (C(1))-methyltransferase [Nitrospirales bacterium]